jgi:hypothetical protein
MIAARYGHRDCIRLLVDAGATIEAKPASSDKGGVFPMLGSFRVRLRM